MYKCSGLSSPGNLVITERRDTSVTLKWDEPTGMADISYYEVNYIDVSLCTLIVMFHLLFSFISDLLAAVICVFPIIFY